MSTAYLQAIGWLQSEGAGLTYFPLHLMAVGKCFFHELMVIYECSSF